MRFPSLLLVQKDRQAREGQQVVAQLADEVEQEDSAEARAVQGVLVARGEGIASPIRCLPSLTPMATGSFLPKRSKPLSP